MESDGVLSPDSEEYRLLYCDDDGQLIDLFEVQLSEPIPTDRIPKLRNLLDSSNFTAAYAAARLLAAWADPKGLEKVRWYIENDVHADGIVSEHRLGPTDMVYEEIAEALEIGLLQESQFEQEIIAITRLLIDRFESHYFGEGRLESLALKAVRIDTSLLPELVAATRRALNATNRHWASALLPAIAAADARTAWGLLTEIGVWDGTVHMMNLSSICRALSLIRTDDSRRLVIALGAGDERLSFAVSQALKTLDTPVDQLRPDGFA